MIIANLLLKFLLIACSSGLLVFYFSKDFYMVSGIIAVGISMASSLVIPYMMTVSEKELKKLNIIFIMFIFISVTWAFFLNIDRLNIALIIFIYIVSNISERTVRKEFLKKFQPHIFNIEE